MNWYYAQGDQRQGPVSETDFDALIAAGTITENTLVWKEGMANWAPLKEVRPAGAATAPPGWIRCTATGRFFPPEEIVYIDGKPYSAAAKPAVLQGLMQGGSLPNALTTRNGPAWEERQQLGVITAAWQTIRNVLTEPNATFTAMKREGGLGTPLSFYIPFGWIGGVFSLLYVGVQFALQSSLPGQTSPFPFKIGVPVLVGFAILMPLFLVLGSFIGAGILHVSLMVCQGAKQPFEATYRTYCYVRGSAAMLLVVPLCGAYVSGIWALVCLCIGIARTHEITTGRAVLAVLLPAIVFCVGIFILAFGFGFLFSMQNAHH